MTDKTLYAAIIFVLTYLLITVQKIPGLKLDRPAGVSIGATLMILSQVITLDEAYGFIDLNTLAFLLGMMISIAYLGISGFFELVASWIVQISGNTSRMLFLVIFSSGILSGLFVVMGGVEKSGLSDILFEKTSPLLQLPSWKGMLSISGATLVLSNLVSNVPAVILFAPHVSSFSNPENTWLVLAMASTLAGNFTLVGSVANLIVAEIAKEGGVTIGFWEYFKVGRRLPL